MGTSIFAQFNKNRQYTKACLTELNLTTEQQEKFNNIINDYQTKMIDLRANVQKNQLEMRKKFNNSNFNEKDLRASLEKKSAFRKEMDEAKLNKWIAINNLLNDDQKKIWKEKFMNKDGFHKKGKSKFDKMHKNKKYGRRN